MKPQNFERLSNKLRFLRGNNKCNLPNYCMRSCHIWKSPVNLTVYTISLVRPKSNKRALFCWLTEMGSPGQAKILIRAFRSAIFVRSKLKKLGALVLTNIEL